MLNELITGLGTGQIRVIDLTAPLGPDTPVIELPPQFGQSPGFSIETISEFDAPGPYWYWNTIRMGEHTGTHFDAPVHWISGKDLPNNTCDTIPPERFVGPACVIDVTKAVEHDEDYLLLPEHLEAWERTHGRVPKNSWVLLRTGWSARTDRASFINAREDGPHSPGFHQDTSLLLAKDRDVLGVGVETIGTDAGQAGTFNPPYPNHGIMHGHGKFGLTSLHNLDKLPATGALVVAAPLKILRGSGSPVRVIALAEGDSEEFEKRG